MLEGFQVRDQVLTAYTGREEVVAVPRGVHTIGEGALKACTSMKKAILPPGLRHIGAEAFKGCRKLEEIEIPEGVDGIGDYAFHRCHALKKIALPPSVEELGDCVFLYCDSLEEARIPGVRRLGRQVFVNDVLLRRVELSGELEGEGIRDVFTGCGRLAEFILGDKTSFVIPGAVEAVAGNIPMPDLVRAIVLDILRMMDLEGRTLKEFRTNLKHVDIPEGIEKIGKSCFYDKRGILSIKLPESIREIEPRAFRNCINLDTVSFGREPEHIHEDAFKNCTSLKNIRMPDGSLHELKGIAGMAAEEVPGLVKTIRSQVQGNFRIGGTILLKYLGGESRVEVPEGITAIAEEAFAGNEAVGRVVLPESLEEIGAGAFRDCLLLQTISLPEKLRRIGEGAFENCVKLLRVGLPAGLTGLEDKVFKRCQALKDVFLGEGLKEIGGQAFYGCGALKGIVFPGALSSIGEMAFYRCGALGEVRIPPAVERVGNLAFALSGVRRVFVGGSGREYGTGVFSSCPRLKTLVLEEGVRHIPDRLAYGCVSLKQVVFPGFLESAGRNAWEKTLFLEEWLSERQGEIFWDGRGLEGEVRLPDSVRVVAGGAFYGNGKITGIILPESIRRVGAAAFKGCGELRRVYWPSGTDKLEPEVFSGCRKLEKVEVLGDAEEGTARKAGGRIIWRAVGRRAFYGCESLQSVCLEYVREIGAEAFSGCRSLGPGCVACVSDAAPHPGQSGMGGEDVREPGDREAEEVRSVMDALRRLPCIGERAFEDTAFPERNPDGLEVVGDIVVSGQSCRGEVCLPDGILGISPYAFAGNRDITEVTLPGSLLSIGEGAFWGCGGLAKVRFPKGRCGIGQNAFAKCASLREVSAAALRVGRGAFAYCTSLGRAFVSGISILPQRMFEGCGKLTECSCGRVKAVGAYCFSGCGSLAYFDFSSVYVVREYAFEGCDSLRQAVFLKDGICVSAHGFADCGRLEEVRLWGKEGLVRLREYAFSGCTALRRVGIGERDWEFCSYGDILSERIPETARLIFHSAMSCFEVEREENLVGYRGAGRRISIPRGIRRIGAEVFRDMMTLEEVDIPESVEYIGARAFHQTAWMEGRRKLSPMVAVNHMLLDGSGCVGEVVVPKDIRLVCGWAFANGLGIERIVFSSERTKVGEYAFRNCVNLKEIVLPDEGCVRLRGIGDRERELPPLAKQAVADSLNCFKTDGENRLTECTGNISVLPIAEGITEIGEGAFQDGNLLTEVTFPPTVTAIGKRAFAGCKWLRKVLGARGVEAVGEMAFFGCGALEVVELSDSFRKLGARAFENCTSLREITVPEGVEEIPDKAFYRCHSLRQVRLPSTLKRIGREAFAFCRGLEQVLAPPGILLEEGAFAGAGVSGEGISYREEEYIGSGDGEDAIP